MRQRDKHEERKENTKEHNEVLSKTAGEESVRGKIKELRKGNKKSK